MNKQKERLESELRELWEDYGGIGEEFLDAAHAIERDGAVTMKTVKTVDDLISKSLNIAVRLQAVLGR